MKNFPFSYQLDSMDCGVACLQMVTSYYQNEYSKEFLREKCFLSRGGVSLLSLSQAAEDIGLKTLAYKITYTQLIQNCPFPCILHWNQEHFVVLYDIRQKGNFIRNLFSKKKRQTNINSCRPCSWYCYY